MVMIEPTASALGVVRMKGIGSDGSYQGIALDIGHLLVGIKSSGSHLQKFSIGVLADDLDKLISRLLHFSFFLLLALSACDEVLKLMTWAIITNYPRIQEFNAKPMT